MGVIIRLSNVMDQLGESHEDLGDDPRTTLQLENQLQQKEDELQELQYRNERERQRAAEIAETTRSTSTTSRYNVATKTEPTAIAEQVQKGNGTSKEDPIIFYGQIKPFWNLHEDPPDSKRWLKRVFVLKNRTLQAYH